MNQPLSTSSVVSYTRAQEKFFKRNPGNNFRSFTLKYWQFRSKFRRILPCGGRGMRGWVGLVRKYPPSQSRSPKECSQARRHLDTGFNPFSPALNFCPFSDVVLPFEFVDEIPWLLFKWNLLCSSVPSCTFCLVWLWVCGWNPLVWPLKLNSVGDFRLVSLIFGNSQNLLTSLHSSLHRCLTKNSNAEVVIHTFKPVCVELYKDYKDLGRFMLRYGGETIAAGVVTEVSS